MRFRFDVAGKGRHNLPEIMGGGVALIDGDGDGRLDLFFCNGGSNEPGKPNPFPCRYYHNNGDGAFTDETAKARLWGPWAAMGAAVGDYDRDGRDDLFVTGWREQRLYRNAGGGRFEDVTGRSGMSSTTWGTSAAWADLDGDGDLDLYVCNYLAFDASAAPFCAAPDGRRDYCGPEDFPAEADRLYRNNGDGTFTDVADAAGIDLPEGRGLGVLVAELTGDDKPDVFVANDGTACWLFENLGALRFREIGAASGVALDGQGGPLAGMGVALGDLDGDGRSDLVVGNILGRSTVVFRSVGAGRYQDASAALGLTAATRGVTGFGLALADFDLDGRLDLIQANGHVLDRARLGVPFAMRTTLLRNTEKGLSDASRTAGLWFDRPILGRGLAVGDLDGDGRPDVVINRLDGPSALLRNESTGRSVAIELIDPGRTTPFGARIRATIGGRVQVRDLVGGGSYLSSSSRKVFLALGESRRIERVEVTWPWGQTETWKDLPAAGTVPLVAGTGTAVGGRSLRFDLRQGKKTRPLTTLMTLLSMCLRAPEVGEREGRPFMQGGSGPGSWRRRPGLVRGVWLIGLASSVFGVAVVVAPSVRSKTDDPNTRFTTVHRADFDSLIVAAGRVESARSTEIRCQLERLATGGVGATILKLIDDGTDVKRNDILCEIDSSEYTEMVRRQSIVVDQSRATFRQAELSLAVAKIGLEAYREGEKAQMDRQCRGQIALARSDLTRQADRLEWSRRMVLKGYLALGQVITEELALKRSRLTLAQHETSLRIFERFTVPISLRGLESQILGTQSTLDFQTIKLQREEEKLVLYKELVGRCVVRAPHDGFLVYANRPGRSPEVFEGAVVRQRMRLFMLPDLSKMTVSALLHETVVNLVRPGMPVRVQIEALPGRELAGTVVSLAPMPYNERQAESGNEATYFLGKIEITTPLDGLRPGMTAELEILADRKEKVLAVPIEAVASDAGADVCYVQRADRLARRTVKLGRSSHDLVEVLDGLKDGESVVLHPPKTALTKRRKAPNAFGGTWDLATFPPPAAIEKRVRAPRSLGAGEGRQGRRRGGGQGGSMDLPPGF